MKSNFWIESPKIRGIGNANPANFDFWCARFDCYFRLYVQSYLNGRPVIFLKNSFRFLLEQFTTPNYLIIIELAFIMKIWSIKVSVIVFLQNASNSLLLGSLNIELSQIYGEFRHNKIRCRIQLNAIAMIKIINRKLLIF